MKERFDKKKRVQNREVLVGDRVWVRDMSTFKSKFEPRFQGPFVVTSVSW